MATAPVEATEEQAPAEGTLETGQFENRGHDRFQKIETERFMFNPTKCYGDRVEIDRLPLIGFLVNMIPMPPIRRGVDKKTGEPIMQEWEALVIKITEPAYVLDREKKVVRVEKGSEVLIPGTHQLTSFLARASSHPKFCYEVKIEPNKKIDIGNGQTMWTYNLAANPKGIPREKLGITALLTQDTPAPMLPAPTNAPDNAGTAADDDIPF